MQPSRISASPLSSCPQWYRPYTEKIFKPLYHYSARSITSIA